MKDLNLVLRLRADGKGFVGEIKQSGQAVKQLGTTGQTTATQLKSTERQMDAVSRQTSVLRGRVLALAGGFSALQLSREVTRTLAQYQDLRTQITALVGGQQEWAETEQYLIAVSGEHNKVLTDMAGNYARLATLQEAGLVTLEESRQIFEGMSNVQSQTGASAVQLQQAMYGLSQALASPVVRAEELNQIVEPLPGLLNKLDEAAGLPAGGFRRMMLAGEVTSDFFKTTLIKALADYDGAAERLSSNINAQFAEITNVWQQAVVAFEDPVSDGLSPVLGGISSGLSLLAENAETVNTVIGVAFAAALGRGAAALVVLSTEKVKAIAASRAKLAATIAEAKAEEQLALRQKAAALTSVQAQAATARLTAARTTLAAATHTATVATRAFGGAMALMGGPAGIVMMAAGALAYWVTTSGDADQANKDLAGSTDLLNKKLTELSQNQLAVAQLDARDAIRAIEQQIKDAQSQIDNTNTTLTVSSYATGGEPVTVVNQEGLDNVVRLNASVEALNNRLATQKSRLEDINTLLAGGKVKDKPEDPAGLTPGGSDKQDAAERLLASLKKQTSLYGQTSQAAKVLYEIEQGGLKGVNAELHPQLLAEAKKLDLLNAQKEAADAARQAEQQLADMRRQSVLGSDATQQQKVQYDIDNGDLADVDPSLQKELLEAAADLDRQKAEQKAQHRAEAFEQEVTAIQMQNEVLQAMAVSQFEADRERAQQEHETRMEALAEQFEQAYEAALGNETLQSDLERQYFTAREGLFQQHQLKLTQIEKNETEKRRQMQMQQLQNYGSLFGSMADIAGAFAGEQSGVYKGLFAVSKAFSIAESVMAIQTGIAKAWELGFPAGIPAAAAVLSNTASIISTIQGTQFSGQAHDGIARVPASHEGTWMLRRDEMVMNPAQTDNFNWMLAYMAQMKQAITASTVAPATGTMPMLIRFEGLPEGYSASQTTEAGQLVALIKTSSDQTYNRIARDMSTGSGAVGRVFQGGGRK